MTFAKDFLFQNNFFPVEVSCESSDLNGELVFNEAFITNFSELTLW